MPPDRSNPNSTDDPVHRLIRTSLALMTTSRRRVALTAYPAPGPGSTRETRWSGGACSAALCTSVLADRRTCAPISHAAGRDA